jgi:hypothetical protein
MPRNLQFTATVIDAFATEKAIPAYLIAPDAVLAATIDAVFTAWIAQIASLSDAILVRGQSGIGTSLPATHDRTWPEYPRSRVEFAGRFSFWVESAGKAWSTFIPSFALSQLINNRIDLSSGSAPDYLVQLMSNKLEWATLYGVYFTNDHSQEITSFVGAGLSTHKARKQLSRSSFEAAP